MPKANKKLVLAYSGGLDTSYCTKYLALQGWEVHAVTVNTGGFSDTELKAMEERAYQLGVTSFQCVNAVEKYYDQYIRYLIFGNILRANTYPLSVSAERMFQAIEIAKVARKIGVQAIAHGSTGAGNDQVRFDLAFQVICPELEIITPIRDQQLSRQEEVDFLQEHGVTWSTQKTKYSVNQGVWGTSIGGAETLTSHQTLPEDAWVSQLKKTEEETVTLYFTQGELTGVNETTFDRPLRAIQA
jgi:argininosuccinate synthase